MFAAEDEKPWVDEREEVVGVDLQIGTLLLTYEVVSMLHQHFAHGILGEGCVLRVFVIKQQEQIDDITKYHKYEEYTRVHQHL